MNKYWSWDVVLIAGMLAALAQAIIHAVVLVVRDHRRLPLPEIGRHYTIVMYADTNPHLREVVVGDVQVTGYGTFVEVCEVTEVRCMKFKYTFTLKEFWKMAGKRGGAQAQK